MTDTTAPLNILPPDEIREFASKLLGTNPPLEDGIVPGSTRENITQVQGVTGSKLVASRDYKITVQELDGSRALLGNQTELVMRVICKKGDGTNITSTDKLWLREETPTLLWRRVQLEVNKTNMNPCERSDVVKHTIDRLFTNHADRGSDDHGPLAYRQINNDFIIKNEPGQASVSYFKNAGIQDGREIELIRPLTDLPLMGPNDGIIPGFNSVAIVCTTTSKPHNLFYSNEPVTTGDPYMEIVSLEVRTTTVKLLDSVAQSLQAMSAANELQMNADTWIAQEATPTIAEGATTYQSGPSLAFSTTPDVLTMTHFAESTFEPAEPAYEKGHPLRQTWNSIKEMSITSSGECIFAWKGLDKTLQPAYSSLAKAFETSSGAHLHTLSAASALNSVDSSAFRQDGGTGALTFAYRNWGEKQSHKLSPLSIRLNSTYANTSVRSVLFVISKTRHRWNISLISGQTQQVV